MEKSADVTPTPPVESSPSRPPLPSDARRPLRQRAARGGATRETGGFVLGKKRGWMLIRFQKNGGFKMIKAYLRKEDLVVTMF